MSNKGKNKSVSSKPIIKKRGKTGTSSAAIPNNKRAKGASTKTKVNTNPTSDNNKRRQGVIKRELEELQATFRNLGTAHQRQPIRAVTTTNPRAQLPYFG